MLDFSASVNNNRSSVFGTNSIWSTSTPPPPVSASDIFSLSSDLLQIASINNTDSNSNSTSSATVSGHSQHNHYHHLPHRSVSTNNNNHPFSSFHHDNDDDDDNDPSKLFAPSYSYDYHHRQMGSSPSASNTLATGILGSLHRRGHSSGALSSSIAQRSSALFGSPVDLMQLPRPQANSGSSVENQSPFAITPKQQNFTNAGMNTNFANQHSNLLRRLVSSDTPRFPDSRINGSGDQQPNGAAAIRNPNLAVDIAGGHHQVLANSSSFFPGGKPFAPTMHNFGSQPAAYHPVIPTATTTVLEANAQSLAVNAMFTHNQGLFLNGGGSAGSSASSSSMPNARHASGSSGSTPGDPASSGSGGGYQSSPAFGMSRNGGLLTCPHSYNVGETVFQCKQCDASGVCPDCHAGHTGLEPAAALVDHGKQVLLRWLTESSQTSRNVSQAVEGCQIALSQVTTKCANVVTQVKSVSMRYQSAVADREKELLTQIETIKANKTQALKNQIADLENASKTLDSLKETTQRVLISGVTSEVVTAHANLQQSLSDLSEIVSANGLHPHEDDRLIFNPPDSNLLSAIRHIGVVVSSAYAANTTAYGEGLTRCIKDKTAFFFIQAFDHLNERRLQGGDPFQAYLEPVGDEAINRTPGGFNRMRIDLTDRTNGCYVGVYRAKMEGRHRLGITINGHHIKHSPFIVNVCSVRNYAVISQHKLQFGSEGDAEGQLCRPWGICCDSKGNIIVADRSNNRVQFFSREGKFLFKFGESGNRSGQFDRPAGVCVLRNDNIVVADKDNHRIQIFTKNGEFISKFGERGSRPGQFNYPWDVATNLEGRIIVSDTRNHRIQLFTSEGSFLAKYGFDGPEWKNFDSPRGVCCHVDGSILVTDFNNHRLVVVQPNFVHARFLGQEGSGNGQFLRPQGIAVDADGNILIADSRNNRLQVFAPNGTFLTKIGMGLPATAQTPTTSSNPFASQIPTPTSSEPPGLGAPSGGLDRPSGITIAPDGMILVVDFGNNRVLGY